MALLQACDLCTHTLSHAYMPEDLPNLRAEHMQSIYH